MAINIIPCRGLVFIAYMKQYNSITINTMFDPL